jgi:hypothetical protein
VISLYAKGMTTGDIQAHLAETYGTDISRDTISRITDAIVEDMLAWQNRPLDRIYPVILIDAIVVKIRDGQVANRPIYVAMGVNMDGERDVLGCWVGPSGGEGAKFWMGVLTELRNRGRAGHLHRVLRRPQGAVPQGRPSPRPPPQRASGAQGALPRRHRKEAEPIEPDRADQRLEAHPERGDHPLRRPDPGRHLTMTITPGYTQNPTVPEIRRQPDPVIPDGVRDILQELRRRVRAARHDSRALPRVRWGMSPLRGGVRAPCL